MTKRKRQQKAQSRQANARHRQQKRAMRNVCLVERAEKRWLQTQSLLSRLGATLQQTEEEQKGVLRVVYLVTYKGQTQTLRSQSGVRSWIKHIRYPVQEEMSWAERHVWWMIENNCDDAGNPWPE